MVSANSKLEDGMFKPLSSFREFNPPIDHHERMPVAIHKSYQAVMCEPSADNGLNVQAQDVADDMPADPLKGAHALS